MYWARKGFSWRPLAPSAPHHTPTAFPEAKLDGWPRRMRRHVIEVDCRSFGGLVLDLDYLIFDHPQVVIEGHRPLPVPFFLTPLVNSRCNQFDVISVVITKRFDYPGINREAKRVAPSIHPYVEVAIISVYLHRQWTGSSLHPLHLRMMILINYFIIKLWNPWWFCFIPLRHCVERP